MLDVPKKTKAKKLLVEKQVQSVVTVMTHKERVMKALERSMQRHDEVYKALAK